MGSKRGPRPSSQVSSYSHLNEILKNPDLRSRLERGGRERIIISSGLARKFNLSKVQTGYKLELEADGLYVSERQHGP